MLRAVAIALTFVVVSVSAEAQSVPTGYQVPGCTRYVLDPWTWQVRWLCNPHSARRMADHRDPQSPVNTVGGGDAGAGGGDGGGGAGAR